MKQTKQRWSKKRWSLRKQGLVLLVVIMILNLPLITALEISEVFAEEVTENSALIAWKTDQAADSFVNYGTSSAELKKVGDAKTVTEHKFLLTDLLPETQYYYSVESGNAYTDTGANIIDDNSGKLYSFTTLTPDATPPVIVVNLPEMVAGTKLEIVGWTEIGAEINLYIDGDLSGQTVAFKEETEKTISNELSNNTANSGPEINDTKPAGKFTFSNIPIGKDKTSEIKLEAIDKAGNKASWEGKIFSDGSKPSIELKEIPEIVDQSSIELNGNFSEEVSYELFINEKSVAQGQGTQLKESVTLEEGKNILKIVAKDKAGWETVKELTFNSDTQAPNIMMKVEKGNEFYQGRAVSNINGETEPGATIYLYVYRPLTYEWKPDFKRARAKVTADQNGSFTFEDINFEEEPLNLKDLAPKQVPSGLQEYSIFPVSQVTDQQQFSYYLFVVAEDKTGKGAYAQTTITVNTCYSSEWGFDVQSLAQFQRPLRLDPGLLDEGREEVTAVFNFSYRGSGSPKINVLNAQEVENAFEITNVQFDRACTQSMMNDEAFKLGCSIMPATPPKKISNNDKTAWYLTYPLHSSEKLSEKEESYWNEFKKRQLVFPLKIRISYQERSPDGTLGPVKTQTSCYDLGYFVDIPIDSKDMLPDWMADEGLDSITWTINRIDEILPYLEKVIMVTGVGCITSFMGRMVTRWARIFTSKLEAYFSQSKEKDEQCPFDQSKLMLESTIDHWSEISSIFQPENQPRADWTNKDKSLDKLCPWTANMWKLESGLDQAYRWTCDRVFCRKVPASWTAAKEKEQVDNVILSQQQCTATSRGIPLIEVENCNEKIKQDITNPSQRAAELLKDGSFTCYRYNDKLYVVTSEQEEYEVGELIKLEMVHDFGVSIQQGAQYIGYSDLFAYRPQGSDQFIVGQDKSCAAACKNKQKSGYSAAISSSILNYANEKATTPKQNGCYAEYYDPANGRNIILISKDEQGKDKKMVDNQYSAGYTQDCFINFDKTNTGEVKLKGQNAETGETGLLQCVCDVNKEAAKPYTARVAAKESADGMSEDWDYQQAQVFKDSNGRFGTYYPEWRYYDGRDFSSAFGADYLTDYLRPKDQEQVAEIDPHTQFLGVYQTICLSGVRAHLRTLKSILQGLQNCIEEAKISGLQDAGVCKTIFSQHVCGLMYKAIAYFFTDCSPYSMADELKGEGGAVESVGAVFKSGFGSIGEAMQSSIDDIKSDYGNAQLNQFFATGAQGFAQSMCMAAFGYDWPLGMDFILDSAYAFPMKTTTVVFPAERELATFNPSTGTAVYNYNLGALVLPGCKIKSANVYLKCVGTEDLGHPGVQCKNQGCDCLHTTEQSGVEGEKVRYLDSGKTFDLKQGSFVDLKISSPQKIDSSYRYDHVVIDLKLDPYEDEANCFDEGYKDGKFYFPITDVSGPGELVCQVQPSTGRYFCPEVQKMFGGGAGAYLEDPYISCFDKETQSFSSCQTPNLFVKGDQIKIKTHIMTDGEQYCLKLTSSGLGTGIEELGIRQLPQKLPGPFGIEANLGTVTESMFGGLINTLQLAEGSSDLGCNNQIRFESAQSSATQTGTKSYSFSYDLQNGQYRIIMPSGVIPDAPYLPGTGNVLTDSSGKVYFTPSELNSVRFNLDGFKAYNLIGSPQGNKKVCTYYFVPAAGQGYAQNQKPISVTAELLMPDLGGNCFSANIPVKAPAFGKSKHTESIILQLEPFVSQITSKMHQEFLKGNCQFVQQNAKEIINRKKSDLEDALAIYYSVACYVTQAGNNWAVQYKNQICTLLDIFFNRNYQVLGEKGELYPAEVTNTVEYQKMEKYLSEIKNKAGCSLATGGTAVPTAPSAPGSTPTTPQPTTCGHPESAFVELLKHPAGWKPSNWNSYVCREALGTSTADPNNPGAFGLNNVCWSRGMYSTEEFATSKGLQWGCPGVQLCCPPTVS